MFFVATIKYKSTNFTSNLENSKKYMYTQYEFITEINVYKKFKNTTISIAPIERQTAPLHRFALI